jgi:hypothetical protein
MIERYEELGVMGSYSFIRADKRFHLRPLNVIFDIIG